MNIKLKNFIVSILRRGSYKHKPRQEALNCAKIKVGEFSTGRARYKYKCASCGELFMRKDICLDHIKPVVPVEWEVQADWNWGTYLERMYCGAENYQTLCSECHDVKTKGENNDRKKYKAEAKKAKKA
ncbi:MAG: HNH endonuclease [Candidatus Heimdallarchaeaceae archaeon]